VVDISWEWVCRISEECSISRTWSSISSSTSLTSLASWERISRASGSMVETVPMGDSCSLSAEEV